MSAQKYCKISLLTLTMCLFAVVSPQETWARSFRPAMLPQPDGDRFNCATCHVRTSGGGPRNSFGEAVNAVVTPGGRQDFWPLVFNLDSDGDGFTNGEELGDADGDGLQDAGVTRDDTFHPGDASSVPPEPEPEPPTNGSGLDDTKTRYSLPLPEPPIIDGQIDPAAESWNWAGGASGNNWRVTVDNNLEDFIRGGTTGDAGDAPFDNEDLSFNIFVGHDDDNLYVAVQINDFDLFDDSAEAGSENGQTWLDDSVEVFIDGDNSNVPDRDTTGSNPSVVDTGGQYVITLNNAYRHAEAGNPGFGENDSWYAQADFTDLGWDAEFRISLDSIGNPQPGDVIGFSIAVNDDDDGGPAERQVIWVGSPHTESTYGNLVIGGKTYTAPKTDAPTVDGSIGEGEYAGAETMVVNGFTGVYHIGVGDDTWEDGDNSFLAWATHDDENVYVAIDVTDDQIFTDTAEAGSEDGQTWVDDSIEIFFDADNSDDQGRGMDGFEGQYVLTANGAWRDNEANNPTFGENGDWFAATTQTDDGFQMEFKVLKSGLFDPEDGTLMGFNIALNDDDGAGRKLQLNWSGNPHEEFTYGGLILGAPAGPAEPPAISIASNGDGSITVTFEGTLQAANDVRGPYVDVTDESPLVLPADQPMQFGRARW